MRDNENTCAFANFSCDGDREREREREKDRRLKANATATNELRVEKKRHEDCSYMAFQRHKTTQYTYCAFLFY